MTIFGRIVPLALISLSLLAACTSARLAAPNAATDLALINARLDILHQAAATPDFDAYFACYTQDAIFLGTDASERWTLDEFQAYARPHFSRGQGWTYTPRERHVDFAGGVAFFDELLDNAKYGTCRGSGVLVRVPDAGGHQRWLVKQYNLAFTVPNEVAEQVAEISRGNRQRSDATPSPPLETDFGVGCVLSNEF